MTVNDTTLQNGPGRTRRRTLAALLSFVVIVSFGLLPSADATSASDIQYVLVINFGHTEGIVYIDGDAQGQRLDPGSGQWYKLEGNEPWIVGVEGVQHPVYKKVKASKNSKVAGWIYTTRDGGFTYHHNEKVPPLSEGSPQILVVNMSKEKDTNAYAYVNGPKELICKVETGKGKWCKLPENAKAPWEISVDYIPGTMNFGTSGATTGVVGWVAVTTGKGFTEAAGDGVTSIDYSNWISDNLDILGNQTLESIVIPGSHDAGMSKASGCHPSFVPGNSVHNIDNLVKTQRKTIAQQLESGIRYFDIRPVRQPGGGNLERRFIKLCGIGWVRAPRASCRDLRDGSRSPCGTVPDCGSRGR